MDRLFFYLIRRIETVYGDSRADCIEIGLRQFQNSCTVGTVQNRDCDAALRKHGDELRKQLHLTGRGAFVPLIRPGKMGEEPLDADSWKTADPHRLLCSGGGIQGDVDG